MSEYLNTARIPVGHICIDHIEYADLIRDNALYKQAVQNHLIRISELKEQLNELQSQLAEINAWFDDDHYHKTRFEEWRRMQQVLQAAKEKEIEDALLET